MKLKKLIAVLALVAGSSYAQPALEDLTDSSGILVKNNFGECVTVLANQNLTGCGQGEVAAVEYINDTQVVSLSADAYFDFDKAVLKESGKATIQQLAQELNARGANVRRIIIVGHTDSVGSDQYNQGLSERRAAAVANYLVENGVPASLLQVSGEGERNPVASNSTAEGRAQNRRVDITVDGVIERTVRTVVQ